MTVENSGRLIVVEYFTQEVKLKLHFRERSEFARSVLDYPYSQEAVECITRGGVDLEDKALDAFLLSTKLLNHFLSKSLYHIEKTSDVPGNSFVLLSFLSHLPRSYFKLQSS